MRKGVSLVGGAVALLVLFVIGTSLYTGDLSLSSGSQSGDYEQFIDEELAQYQGVVAVNQLIDPWASEVPEDQPAPGHRFVALEVTIDNPRDRSDTLWADAEGFKLRDGENFVYVPTSPRVQAQLPEVELEPGEKASGWVVFEVNEHNSIESLSYWSADVALPR